MKWEFFMGKTNKIWINGIVWNSYTNVDMNFLDGTKEDTTQVKHRFLRNCPLQHRKNMFTNWMIWGDQSTYVPWVYGLQVARKLKLSMSILTVHKIPNDYRYYSWWQLPPRNPRKIFPPFSNSFWDPHATFSCQKASWLKKNNKHSQPFSGIYRYWDVRLELNNEVTKYGEPIPSSEWIVFARWTHPTYKVSWTPNVDSVLIRPMCEWMTLFSS